MAVFLLLIKIRKKYAPVSLTDILIQIKSLQLQISRQPYISVALTTCKNLCAFEKSHFLCQMQTEKTTVGPHRKKKVARKKCSSIKNLLLDMKLLS